MHPGLQPWSSIPIIDVPFTAMGPVFPHNEDAGSSSEDESKHPESSPGSIPGGSVGNGPP